jgi:hypothetical protein
MVLQRDWKAPGEAQSWFQAMTNNSGASKPPLMAVALQETRPGGEEKGKPSSLQLSPWQVTSPFTASLSPTVRWAISLYKNRIRG